MNGTIKTNRIDLENSCPVATKLHKQAEEIQLLRAELEAERSARVATVANAAGMTMRNKDLENLVGIYRRNLKCLHNDVQEVLDSYGFEDTD